MNTEKVLKKIKRPASPALKVVVNEHKNNGEKCYASKQ